MAKQFEANEDWIKRDQGRIPTKGAAAAARASAGLGTLSDDEALLLQALPPRFTRVGGRPGVASKDAGHGETAAVPASSD